MTMTHCMSMAAGKDPPRGRARRQERATPTCYVEVGLLVGWLPAYGERKGQFQLVTSKFVCWLVGCLLTERGKGNSSLLHRSLLVGYLRREERATRTCYIEAGLLVGCLLTEIGKATPTCYIQVCWLVGCLFAYGERKGQLQLVTSKFVGWLVGYLRREERAIPTCYIEVCRLVGCLLTERGKGNSNLLHRSLLVGWLLAYGERKGQLGLNTSKFACWLVACLTSQQCLVNISGTNLRRQFYVLPH